MVHPLIQAMAEKLRSGLAKKSITTASKWACNYRVMGGKDFPGPWNFRNHPWLKEMHDSRSVGNVGQKSAQMGFTEAVLNITFFKIDYERVDCLYILPSQHPDASDFSASRFDPALELSPYLSTLFSEVKNVGHKRAGATNLYIRGSRSRSGLKSIPAGFIVFDELAEMDQENINLAMERSAGQIEKQDWKISTPTVEDSDINFYFKQSTMEHFFFKCPSCSKHIELKFPESIVITGENAQDPKLMDSHLICYECKAKLHHELKSEYFSDSKWVPSRTTSFDTRGFYINQLYSCAVKPSHLAKKYFLAQADATTETEFYNSNLGQPHAVKGAQITDDDLNKCIGPFKRASSESYIGKDKIRTLGCDTGKWWHFVINEWDIPRNVPMMDINLYCRPRVIHFGKLPEGGHLDELMQRFSIAFAVVDANPLRREAYSFCNRNFGRARMCFYSKSISARQLVPSVEVDQAINVDRTSWLDLSLGRFHRGPTGVMIPQDIDEEFRSNMKAQVRVYLKDKDNNPVGKYITAESRADHYGHAFNYAEIALPLALGVGESENLDNPL